MNKKLLKIILMLLAVHGFAQNTWTAQARAYRSIYEVPIALDIKAGTVDQLFDSIEEKTEFTFTYNSHAFNAKTRITLLGNEKTVGAVLERISQQSNVEFKQVNTILVVKPVLKSKSGMGSGAIKGRILDKLTNDRLPGATVRIVGSNTGCSSDLNGEFFLRVPAGSVELEVSYIGFKNEKQVVEVAEDQIVELEIVMTSDITQLDNVIITGVFQNQQKALNQQKSADNIVNVVSADQIGRFPDPNVAEALQRVPAVNIERDQGEGRYVLVRGLAPQFTNISINGEQIPSPEAGVRFVALDAVPADQLSSIEVTKSLTPDMDGDAIGGSVNLVTRRAQSETPSISASALLGYNKIVKRGNFQGSLELGQRFLNNRLGIMINSSYYESDRGSDNWERDDDEMELRDYELVRTRLGLSSTIDYQLSDQSEVYFRTIYNRFTDREQRMRAVFVPNVDASPFEDHEIERLTKDRLEKQIVSSFNLGGKHQLSGFNLDYEVAYSEAIQDTPFDIEVGSVAEFDDLTIDFNSDINYPSFLVNGKNQLDPTNDYLVNSNYEFDEVTFGNTYALDVNKTAKFNIGIPFQAGKNSGLFKFGGKVRLKEKSYDITENVFGYTGTSGLTLNQYEGANADNNFLGGKYLVGNSADAEQFVKYFNANRQDFELDTESKIAAEAVEAYSATEDVYAGYAMSKFQFKKLMLLGGFRYELTKVSYQSEEVVYDFDENITVSPVSGSRDYAFLLPQLHVKYQVNDQVNVRAAVTRSYARPNFEDIVPSQEIEFTEREGSIGNPNLKPVAATNIDLLAEKYFGNVGIISAGFYYKQLSDFIFRSRFETDSYPGAQGVNLTLTQSKNGDRAQLFGFEFAINRNLTFLPGALKGLSIYANYTFTSSEAEIQSRTNDTGTEKIRLPGQARHIGNFALGYDYKRINVRIASNFNGEYLSEVGDDADEDLYVKDRLQLDATATYTINQKLRFFTEFLNITNQPFEVYQGNESRYVQREFYQWWMRVGLKFDL